MECKDFWAKAAGRDNVSEAEQVLDGFGAAPPGCAGGPGTAPPPRAVTGAAPSPQPRAGTCRGREPQQPGRLSVDTSAVLFGEPWIHVPPDGLLLKEVNI